MYAGRIVETGPVSEVFARPRHPYTVGLMRSVPRLGQATALKAAGTPLPTIAGNVPSLAMLPKGCSFAPQVPDGDRRLPRGRAAAVPGVADAGEPLHPLGGAMSAAAPYLSVRNLTKHFAPTAFSRGPVVKALQDISFDIPRGQVVGLVGESGSGKTTIGRSVLRLIEPTSGEISFDGKDIIKLGAGDLRRQRRNMQYIFQDPFASLSPRMTIGQILTEGLDIQRHRQPRRAACAGRKGARRSRAAGRCL